MKNTFAKVFSLTPSICKPIATQNSRFSILCPSMAYLSSPLFYSIRIVLCLSFSFLLLSTLSLRGAAAGNRHEVSITSLLPAAVCSSSKASLTSSNLNIIHRHGPCSPTPHVHKPSHTQILNQDESRAHSLHRRASQSTRRTSAAIPDHTGISLGTANYIVKIGLGTPKSDFSVVFDTGSDLTWIQCKPCTKCYPQQDPLFDPSHSSTLYTVPCNATACSAIVDNPLCTSNSSTCRYTVQYSDNSQSTGTLVRDTLTLTPSNTVPGFLYGCGDQSIGLFGQTAGLLGLGRGNVSLPMQTAKKYSSVFSYCLPTTSSSVGYLKLGGTVPKNVRYTPMLPHGNFYVLDLVAIIVGGQKLSLPPMTFSALSTVLDSGTVITRLPPTAYAALRAAFRQGMMKYPEAAELAILDTCYNFTGYETVKVPTVALLFGGEVLVDVDLLGILYVASVSQACLAFVANDDAGDVVIIGNHMQRRYNVVYDLGNQRIGFGPKGCK